MKQKLLPLTLNKLTSVDNDFVISLCNVEAYRAVSSNALWPNNRLLILGEEGSGKSHLASIWSQRTNAILYTPPFEELYNLSISSMLIENIDYNVNEKELFHLINYSMEEGINILMTARTLTKFYLQDLNSRLKNTYTILIRQPDDELVNVLLHKYFTDNQIYVESEVFEYILSRLERSFSAISKFLKQVDYASFQEKKSITIPFVKNFL